MTAACVEVGAGSEIRKDAVWVLCTWTQEDTAYVLSGWHGKMLSREPQLQVPLGPVSSSGEHWCGKGDSERWGGLREVKSHIWT